MPLKKENKMILLFVSVANPLWKDIMGRDQEIKLADVCDIIKISQSTIPNWKKGVEVSPTTVNKIFLNTLAYLENIEKMLSGRRDALKISEMSEKKIDSYIKNMDSYIEKNNLTVENIVAYSHRVKQFKAAYNAAELHVYEIGKILLMDIDDCQKIIDEAIYERHPIFPNMYHDDSKTLDEFKESKGMYYAFVRRGKVWLKCTLRVRYVLKIRDGNTIRCKLNIPIIRDRHRYWEYDGFLIVRDRALFWFFEKREQNRIDYFSFITYNRRLYGGKYTLTGTYLTTDQDSGQSVVTGPILLQQELVNDVKRIENSMETDVDVIEGDGRTKIQNIFTNFQKGGTGLEAEEFGSSIDNQKNIITSGYSPDAPD